MMRVSHLFKSDFRGSRAIMQMSYGQLLVNNSLHNVLKLEKYVICGSCHYPQRTNFYKEYKEILCNQSYTHLLLQCFLIQSTVPCKSWLNFFQPTINQVHLCQMIKCRNASYFDIFFIKWNKCMLLMLCEIENCCNHKINNLKKKACKSLNEMFFLMK